MKRAPLKRKTPLNRTGINRVSNRECVKSEGPRVVKPRARLRAKSKRNSNRHVNKSINDIYRANNTQDEIIHLFPRWARWYAQMWQTETRYDIVPFPRDRDHVHHICYGIARRWDIVTNLISLSQISHDWVLAHKVEGRILCLYAKWEKCELDWAELSRIYGKDFKALIAAKEPSMSWCVPLWQALIESN